MCACVPMSVRVKSVHLSICKYVLCLCVYVNVVCVGAFVCISGCIFVHLWFCVFLYCVSMHICVWSCVSVCILLTMCEYVCLTMFMCLCECVCRCVHGEQVCLGHVVQVSLPIQLLSLCLGLCFEPCHSAGLTEDSGPCQWGVYCTV